MILPGLSSDASPTAAGGGTSGPVCWVVSDGNAGNENQALGLAEALGLAPVVYRLPPPEPRWTRALDPLRPTSAFGLAGPPWPDLLISAGRRGAHAALAARRAGAASTYLVHILRPPATARHFDLVIAPRHDRLAGPNVMETRGSLNRITPERLASAAAALAPCLPPLPRPLVTVLIGGSSKSVAVPEGAMAAVAEQLAQLAEAGAGLLVTASRRTRPADMHTLAARLADRPAHLWDGAGDNPYFGFLGLADAVVVTSDSIAMASEAATTGKPVHVAHWAPLPPKFRAFHDGLVRDGIARPFTGRVEHWTYRPLDDTPRAAARVREMLAAAARR